MFEKLFTEKIFLNKKAPSFLKKLGGDILFIKNIPAKEAKYGVFPNFDRRIKDALTEMGIVSLYSHQNEAFSLALSGKDIVIVTPTASGKTFCYNLPVIETMLRDEKARALYLFPSKALAQDQMSELRKISSAMCFDIKPFTYDGDTSAQKRRAARETGRILITNPDMLSVGILPHHEYWADFFRNLKFIIVDELHTYKGVFGSHLANIFTRAARICAFYGSHPIFICCSATIANPLEHAEALTGRKMEMISENGAPSPEKDIIIYSPPLAEKKTKTRRSSLFDSALIASEAVSSGINTIVFTKSRTNVELITDIIRKKAKKCGDTPEISGYRAGYLPRERRIIERGLRSGKIKCVVSTNALELGIDIGSLELAVLHGYPGSIAAAWQQIGRAGRRGRKSYSVIVASSRPLDRFLASHPEWFFGASPETALISPMNPYIFVDHVKCSCFELPFRKGELFAGRDVSEILDFLADNGILLKTENFGSTLYVKNRESHPASEINFRNSYGRPYNIIDTTESDKGKIIGIVDSASTSAHIFPGASYFHNGHSYTVDKLDTDKLRCYVKKGSPDIYTEADLQTRIKVTCLCEASQSFGWGEALLVSVPYIYKIKDRRTHEIIGHGKIEVPPTEIATTSFWMCAPIHMEDSSELKAAMEGLAGLFETIAPIFLMCSSEDIKIHIKQKDPILKRSAIFIADTAPGGVGLAEGSYAIRGKLLDAAIRILSSCNCTDGCPNCTGKPQSELNLKKAALKLAEELLAEYKKS